jgi:hypothetical protein
MDTKFKSKPIQSQVNNSIFLFQKFIKVDEPPANIQYIYGKIKTEHNEKYILVINDKFPDRICQ